MVENENNANELENNSNETSETKEETEKDSQSEANETKTETGTELDEQTESDEDLTEELKPTYTSDLIETDNFTLQVDHYMTAGDMLVSTLLAANIAVMLLCRLLRDRK